MISKRVGKILSGIGVGLGGLLAYAAIVVSSPDPEEMATACRQHLQSLGNSIEDFDRANGHYPQSLSDLPAGERPQCPLAEDDYRYEPMGELHGGAEEFRLLCPSPDHFELAVESKGFLLPGETTKTRNFDEMEAEKKWREERRRQRRARKPGS